MNAAQCIRPGRKVAFSGGSLVPAVHNSELKSNGFASSQLQQQLPQTEHHNVIAVTVVTSWHFKLTHHDYALSFVSIKHIWLHPTGFVPSNVSQLGMHGTLWPQIVNPHQLGDGVQLAICHTLSHAPFHTFTIHVLSDRAFV